MPPSSALLMLPADPTTISGSRVPVTAARSIVADRLGDTLARGRRMA